MAIVDFYVGGNSSEPAVPHSTGVPHEIQRPEHDKIEREPVLDPDLEDLPRERLDNTVVTARGYLEKMLPFDGNRIISNNS